MSTYSADWPYEAVREEGWSLVRDRRDGTIVATFPYSGISIPGASQQMAWDFMHRRAEDDSIARNEAAKREFHLLAPSMFASELDPQLITVDDVVINLRGRYVTRAGQEIELTKREFDLLRVLARDPLRVCSRQELVDELWNGYDAGSTRTLDAHACRLRAKLGGDFVLNLRGVGYRLTRYRDVREVDRNVA